MPVETAPQESPFAHGRNRIARQLLDGEPVAQLLDYGCGDAQFALAVKRELGAQVHACDIDAELIERLRAELGAELDLFAVSDRNPRLALADGQVSAITCCDVLEHMPPALRSAALAEMRRVLDDGGALIVTTPHKGISAPFDPENVKYYFPRVHRLVFTALKGREKYASRYGGERFGNFSSGAMRHLHFSRRELSGMLEQAGFEVEQVRFYTLVWPFVKTLLWFAESLARRVRAARPLAELCWKAYVWDADLEPGRLGGSIAVRARKRAGASFGPNRSNRPAR